MANAIYSCKNQWRNRTGNSGVESGSSPMHYLWITHTNVQITKYLPPPLPPHSHFPRRLQIESCNATKATRSQFLTSPPWRLSAYLNCRQRLRAAYPRGPPSSARTPPQTPCPPPPPGACPSATSCTPPPGSGDHCWAVHPTYHCVAVLAGVIEVAAYLATSCLNPAGRLVAGRCRGENIMHSQSRGYM